MLRLLNKRALSVASWQMNRRHHHLATLRDRLVADIASHTPDAIVITGDLTNFGLPSEFRAAASWLATLPTPTAIIPGNHDAMVPYALNRGRTHWEPWLDRAFPHVRTLGRIALIGVNTGIPTLPFMAYGRTGNTQTRRLRALLTHLGKAGYCRVVMIHHPPRPGLVPWRKSLLDHARTANALRTAGAELVLHGHSHNSTTTTLPGSDIPLIGIASASLESRKPWRMAAWNRIRIQPSRTGWQIDIARRALDPALGETATPTLQAHTTLHRPKSHHHA